MGCVSTYDTDPAALAWARAAVQRRIDHYRGFEAKARTSGSEERAAQWRKMANLLHMDFIGGEGCVIAAFDERRPSLPDVTLESDQIGPVQHP
jgi:hypothetical protein